MDASVAQLLMFGVFAALANVLGGLAVFPSTVHPSYKKSLKYLLALGAGFMLAVTFFEIVPKTILLWQKRRIRQFTENLYPPMLLLLVGYLVTQFLEHTIAPHFHLGEEEHPEHDHSEGVIDKVRIYRHQRTADPHFF